MARESRRYHCSIRRLSLSTGEGVEKHKKFAQAH